MRSSQSWLGNFIVVLVCVSASMSTWAIMNVVFGSEYAVVSREDGLQRSLDRYKSQYENLRKKITEVRSTALIAR